MSNNVPPPQASTSSNPHNSHPAIYHPHPRPAGISIPFERIDVHAIKQELHDALGEDGLPYWKAVNGYLMGQVGKGELTEMVKGWLKGKKLQLHDRLLVSLLHNAAAPPQTHPLPSPATTKRRKIGTDPSEFDTDDTKIEPRSRVGDWIRGLGGAHRARVLRIMSEAGEEEEEDEVDALTGHIATGKDWGKKRKWETYSSNTSLPPLACSSGHLPSSNQLSQRLSNVAKTFDLTFQDSASDIGEFMAVGIDANLGDILHGIVHLTGRERPGSGTIRVPPGNKRKSGEAEIDDGGMEVENAADGDGENDLDGEEDKPSGGSLPKPTLETLQSLFTMVPGLHAQISPATYKLQTGILMGNASLDDPVEFNDMGINSLTSPTHPNGNLPLRPPNITGGVTNGPVNGNTTTSSPKKPIIPLQRNPFNISHTANRTEVVTQTLLSSGLLKLDKAGRQSEAGGNTGTGEENVGKKGKHNLHWKYEDPAIILKDVLG